MTLDEKIAELEQRAEDFQQYADAACNSDWKAMCTEKSKQFQKEADWLKELRDLKAMRVNQMSEEELASFIEESAVNDTCNECQVVQYCNSNPRLAGCSKTLAHYLFETAEEKEDDT